MPGTPSQFPYPRQAGHGANQFAKGNHGHDAAEVGAASSVHTHTGVYAPLTHTHVESDVTSLVSDLATKLVKTNNLSDVSNAATARSNLGAAAATHSHVESDVTSLVADLAGKASTSHTHAESDVTSLVTDLAGKASTSHTHPYGTYLDSGVVDSADFTTTLTSFVSATGFSFSVTPPPSAAGRTLVVFLTVAGISTAARADAELRRGASVVSLTTAAGAASHEQSEGGYVTFPVLAVDTGFTAGSSNTYQFYVKSGSAGSAGGIGYFSYVAVIL